jgi:sugar phosphate isomerase/epimerase
MKIGCSSMALVPDVLLKRPITLQSINTQYLEWAQESLIFAEANNFDFIEMILESPLNTEVNREFIALCNQFKIPKTIHAPFLDHNLIVMDQYLNQAAMKEYYEAMEIGAAINAQTITFHPGVPTKFMGYANPFMMDLFYSNIQKLGDYFNNNFQGKFNICLENMPKTTQFFGEKEIIRQYFDRPELKEFKMTLDTSHGWTIGGDDHLNALIQLMKDKIIHFHVVDNLEFDKDPHITVGEGKINFHQFIETVKSIGFDGNMVMELPGIKSTLASRNHIEQLLRNKPI